MINCETTMRVKVESLTARAVDGFAVHDDKK